MKIGISKISFYVPKYYLPLDLLAEARGVDPLKYTNGLLQNKMAVAPLNQDIVSMAANAALNFLTNEDRNAIDMVIFATESGLDYSKSAGTYLIELLNLKENLRVIELKQACYSATAGLYFAKGHILQNPNSKVLIFGADIARYGLDTDGEPTQGAGAVAMLIERNPKIVVLNDGYGNHAENIYDFWRPNKHDYAMVDGHFSNQQYKKFFEISYQRYIENTGDSLSDFKAITFHIPYAKIGLRSLQLIATKSDHPNLFENYQYATKYVKEVGNIYSGSLFLSLISLLENGKFKGKDKIGLYSYGSGAVSEFFTVSVVAGYRKHLNKKMHQSILKNRKKLKMRQYATMLTTIPENELELESDFDVKVQLIRIKDYKRYYQKNE